MRPRVPPIRDFEPAPLRPSQSEQFFGTVNGCFTVLAWFMLTMFLGGALLMALGVVVNIFGD